MKTILKFAVIALNIFACSMASAEKIRGNDLPPGGNNNSVPPNSKQLISLSVEQESPQWASRSKYPAKDLFAYLAGDIMEHIDHQLHSPHDDYQPHDVSQIDVKKLNWGARCQSVVTVWSWTAESGIYYMSADFDFPRYKTIRKVFTGTMYCIERSPEQMLLAVKNYSDVVPTTLEEINRPQF